MAASAGTLVLIGKSGRGYIKDLYFDDGAGSPVNWDGGAGAASTSPEQWQPPEDVTITDLIIVSATGQTRSQININNASSGNILLNAVHLSTVVSRPVPRTLIPAGARISITQLP